MFDRFTDRARMVMGLARQEAQRFNHEYIGTEHILLGLLLEGKGTACCVLQAFGVKSDTIRREIEKIVQSGPSMVTLGALPFTPRSKKVLELAVEEASNIGHNYIGTEHLLLGLVKENEGVGAQVLMNLGLQLGEVRKAVINITAPTKPETPVDPPKLKLPTKAEPKDHFFIYYTWGNNPSRNWGFAEFAEEQELLTFMRDSASMGGFEYQVIQGRRRDVVTKQTFEMR